MHVHTVLVKLTDPATLDTCRTLMESMRGEIDDMIDLQVTVNELEAGYSCHLALTTVWPDVAAYQRYADDPAHLVVRNQVLELMDDAMTIDYSTDNLSGRDSS